MERGSQKDRLDRANKLLADAVSKDNKLAERLLNTSELNITASIEKNMAFLDKLERKQKLLTADKRASEYNSVLAGLRKGLEEKLRQIPNPKDVLQQIMNPESEMALHFRKIEEITVEDAIDMLEEVELLKLIEKLEAKDDKTDNKENG